nr:MAG TPA: hypothetical protein [Caudoviricetes sp.]
MLLQTMLCILLRKERYYNVHSSANVLKRNN